MGVDDSNFSDKAKEDLELVNRAVEEGDQGAYQELLRRYQDSIYYMLLKMVNNRSDAEDLTFEAFEKAFRRLDQYTPYYAFSTWLFKIASNNCIDFIRKKKKKTYSIDSNPENDEGDEIEVDLRAQSPDPEEKAINDQKVQMMRDIVDQLKPKYRQLIEMRYFKEYSYEEISDELGIPLGTVKAQLYRAREFLSVLMKNTRDQF